MKGLLLLCVFLVLGPRLRGALADQTNATGKQSEEPSNPTDPSTTLESPAPSTTAATTTTPATSPTIKPTSTSSTSTTSKPVTKGPFHFLSTSECRSVTLVAAGLILASAVLLLSNLMLACRVCTLSRHLRRRSRQGDGEATVLLSHVGPSQEELAKGAAKEEEGGEKEEEDGEKEDEGGEKKVEGGEKKVEGAAPTGENQEEAPAAASPPQEAVTGPQPDAAAASSSEGAEEPKDAV